MAPGVSRHCVPDQAQAIDRPVRIPLLSALVVNGSGRKPSDQFFELAVTEFHRREPNWTWEREGRSVRPLPQPGFAVMTAFQAFSSWIRAPRSSAHSNAHALSSSICREVSPYAV